MFSFKPLEVSNIEERLNLIANKEGVKVTPALISEIAKVALFFHLPDIFC